MPVDVHGQCPVRSTPAGAAIGDQFLVYLVDPNQPESDTLLDRGQSGTAVSRSPARRPTMFRALVQYDGTTVTLDVTSLAKLSPGHAGLPAPGQRQCKAGSSSISVPCPIRLTPAGQAGTVFPQSQATAPAGVCNCLSGLSAASDLQPLVSDVRFDDGTDLVLPQLPAARRRRGDRPAGRGRLQGPTFGVQLQDASPRRAGDPYISFAEAIPDGGLARAPSRTRSR